MSLVNLNCEPKPKLKAENKVPQAQPKTQPSLFTPAPASVETAGSVASAAPAASSFSAVC